MLMHLWILAARRSSEDDLVKLIFGVVVVVIWIAGAIISAINKRAEENKKRLQQGRLPEDVGSRSFVPPQSSGRVAPPVLPGKHQRHRQRGSQQRQQVAYQRPAFMPQPVPPPPPAAYSAPPEPAPPAPPAPARAESPAAAVPEAARVARLLRRPESLRAAFILSQVLGAPAAFKDDSGVGGNHPL